MKNILSFKMALEQGFEPKNFKFNKDMPLGVFEAELIFKIWAKENTAAITCFCKIVSTGNLIRFNVFRNPENQYYLKNTSFDLREMEMGSKFVIEIKDNSRGNRTVVGTTEDEN